MMKKYFGDLFRSRYMVSAIVKLDLKGKYRSSVLGFAWTFLSPLFLVLILGVIYAFLFNAAPQDFIPYLFSALMAWNFISASADTGCVAFLGAQGYIKQMSVPIQIFPLRITLVNLVNYLASLVSYFAMCLIIKRSIFTVHMWLTIPSIVIIFFFALSWATYSSFLHLYFRDYAPMQSLILQALFYVTPLIYPAENLLSGPMAWAVRLNPIYYFVDIIRYPLLGQPPQEANSYLICCIIVVVMYLGKFLLYKKIGRRIAYRL